MKPFRLHTVLRYRRTQENWAQERLIRSREEEERLSRELDREQGCLRELCTEFEDRKRQGMNVGEILVYQNHLRRVRNMIAQRESELQSARDDVARKKQELSQRSRERKLMEKLKEKQDSRYEQYLEDKEKQELDEFAVLFHERGGI